MNVLSVCLFVCLKESVHSIEFHFISFYAHTIRIYLHCNVIIARFPPFWDYSRAAMPFGQCIVFVLYTICINIVRISDRELITDNIISKPIRASNCLLLCLWRVLSCVPFPFIIIHSFIAHTLKCMHTLLFEHYFL